MYHNVKTQRILARNTFVSNDTWTTGLNNNDLLVGPSGAGKTRGYTVMHLDFTDVANTPWGYNPLSYIPSGIWPPRCTWRPSSSSS